MNKFLILLAVFGVVKSEVDIEWFIGKWYPVVQYPQPMFGVVCHTIDFQLKNSDNCTCGDKGAVPVVEHFVQLVEKPHTPQYTAPAIIVDKSEEVADALQIQCKCGEEDKPHEVFRKINEIVFVVYSTPLSLKYFKGEPNQAVVAMKKVSKLSQLREVLKNIDDLSPRKPTYLCDPNYFVNEFEDLD